MCVFAYREEKEHPELVKCALDRRLPLGMFVIWINFCFISMVSHESDCADLSPFEIHMTGLTETVARGIDDIGYVVASDTSTSASVKRKRTRSGSKDPRNECSDKGDSDISAVNVRSNTRLENLLSTGTIDTDSSDNEDGLIEV